QGEDADQVIHEVGDVSAFRGRTTLRDPIEMPEPHDMIDSQAAGMTHIGADGEVAIDADRHAPGAGSLRGFRQLLIGDPLHPGEKIDPIPILLCEPRYGCRAGVLILLGPIPPIGPSRYLRCEIFAQRLEAAEPLERIALLAAK